MKIADVTLVRSEHQTSAIMNYTYKEEVREYTTIEFGPSHTVFILNDGNIIAYRADRVFEVVTYEE